MDPFHVAQLAGDSVNRCRQRVQQETCGHRGRSGDPLYGIRRALHTGIDLIGEKQWTRAQRLRRLPRRRPHAGTPPHVCGDRLPRQGRPPDLDRAAYSRPHPAAAGRRYPRVLRPLRNLQRTHRSSQRQTRTPPRLGPRLPKPHQLHHQSTPRIQRLQTPTTPPNAKSRQTARIYAAHADGSCSASRSFCGTGSRVQPITPKARCGQLAPAIFGAQARAIRMLYRWVQFMCHRRSGPSAWRWWSWRWSVWC